MAIAGESNVSALKSLELMALESIRVDADAILDSVKLHFLHCVDSMSPNSSSVPICMPFHLLLLDIMESESALFNCDSQ